MMLVNAFYAMERRKTPMVVSFIAVALNLVFNWLFTFHLGYGHRGLALSTGLIASSNFVLLYVLMRIYLDGLETNLLLKLLVKIGVASGLSRPSVISRTATGLTSGRRCHWRARRPRSCSPSPPADWSTPRWVCCCGSTSCTCSPPPFAGDCGVSCALGCSARAVPRGGPESRSARAASRGNFGCPPDRPRRRIRSGC